MNKAPKQKRQREQGFPVQEIQYQELNFSSNENPIHNTATWSSVDELNSDSQRFWSPPPDLDQITSGLYECPDEISMSQYLRSPPPVDDRTEGNPFATFSGAYPRTTEDSIFPDSGTVGLTESCDSGESSPQTEDELTHFGAAGTSAGRETWKTKDGRPRQRAPKKYKADFPDEETYMVYKRQMDKERQQRKRDKEKKKKEAMNAGLLFQPMN